jgi:hypothetical protein
MFNGFSLQQKIVAGVLCAERLPLDGGTAQLATAGGGLRITMQTMAGLDVLSPSLGDPQLPQSLRLHGVDFSSAPNRRKPIVVASGQLRGDVLQLHNLAELASLEAWQVWLHQPGPWAAGLDLPLGLPRELVLTLGWPTCWLDLMRHYTRLSRAQIRAEFKAFCAARPAGRKFAHRVCDGPAGASPSMKWVNPPVAFMLHAGVPGLLAAGLELPGLHAGDAQRVALEAYPGLLAREVLGRRSYKSDDPKQQTPERAAARAQLLEALQTGQHRLGLRLSASAEHAQSLLTDAKADRLDAVLCLMQVAWASRQDRWGWPQRVDALEGWILSA